MLSETEFLAINSLVTAFSGLTAIGAFILAILNGSHRRTYLGLFIAAAVLIVQEALILALYTQPRTGLFDVYDLFYYISPPIAWCTLFELVIKATMPRLRKDGLSKSIFSGWILVYIGFLWTALMVCYAIVYSRNLVPFDFLLYGMAAYVILFLAVMVVYFKDVRPLGWTFALFSFFLLCGAVGSITLGAAYTVGDYNPLIGVDEYIRTIAVTLSTATALLVAVISYPTVWIRHINKNQSTDEFAPPPYQNEKMEIHPDDDEPIMLGVSRPEPYKASNLYDSPLPIYVQTADILNEPSMAKRLPDQS